MAHAEEVSAQLLSKGNPPRLEPRHFELLRRAQKEVKAQKARALAAEEHSGRSAEEGPSDTLRLLTFQEEMLDRVCSALFPPESHYDEAKTAEILDFAEAMPGMLGVLAPDQVDPMAELSASNKTTRKNRAHYCLFCKPSTAHLPTNELVYTNLNLLTQFLNERGMIIQRAESRLCMKHQRKLARTVKQARSIGLLSPQSNWRVHGDFVYGPQARQFNPHQLAAVGEENAARVGAAGQDPELEPTSAGQAGAYTFDPAREEEFERELAQMQQSGAFAGEDDIFGEEFGSDKDTYRRK